MFLATRRFALAGSCVGLACMVPPRPSLAEDIRSRIETLNTRDSSVVRNNMIHEIVKWEAMKDNKAFQDACERGAFTDDVLSQLSYMSSFYFKPLKVERKVTARNQLLRVYELCKTDEEKEYILHIMHHFELLE